MAGQQEAIAVIGLATRFPGVRDADAFWLALVRQTQARAGHALHPGQDGTDPLETGIDLLLQSAHTAVENAGYSPGSLPGRVGVFACSGPADDVRRRLLDRTGTAHRAGEAAVAYRFDLHASRPVVLETGSTGLAALATACRSLRTGDCDCLLYTSPSPRDQRGSRMPSSA